VNENREFSDDRPVLIVAPVTEKGMLTRRSAVIHLVSNHDRATVRTGAEISLRLSISQGALLGDFLLAPMCPVEKVTLWESNPALAQYAIH